MEDSWSGYFSKVNGNTSAFGDSESIGKNTLESLL